MTECIAWGYVRIVETGQLANLYHLDDGTAQLILSGINPFGLKGEPPDALPAGEYTLQALYADETPVEDEDTVTVPVRSDGEATLGTYHALEQQKAPRQNDG
ncbi:hypothetical protein CMI37_30335 [Candidatus Pacearchaeota archaeon]|nr:hypothetical protein [Candidatus Pacearchaeota archaeon]|tara:strand:- start:2717 stop:3022 length:306 start_codon:yes stop_codon:yes gene_type:complete